MKLDRLRERKELVSIALLVVSAVAALLIMCKATRFFAAPAEAVGAVKDAVEQSKPDSKNLTAQLDKHKKIADGLKMSNLFSPPAPKQNPITAVMGIFGDEVLINGKWYKAGDKVGYAKILAVNPTSVETEWDGKKKTFSPIDSGATSGPSGPSRPVASSRGSVSSSGKGPRMVVTKSAAGTKPAKFDKGENPVFKKASQTYKNMSDAQRGTFKRVMKDRAEQYKQMSDSERANFKAHIIERISQSGKR